MRKIQIPIPLNMTNARCMSGCTHERHKAHHGKFTNYVADWQERTYYQNVVKYIMDPNISPSDPDDFEMFQDMIFESPWGRVHIHFYEQLFKNYYQYYPDWVMKVFSRYLEFLNKASPLFTGDAFGFIFNKNDVPIIEKLLKELPFDIKMQFIRHSEKYPTMMKAVPKLKLYNLFS